MSHKYSVDEVFDMLGRDTLNQTGELIKSESVEVDGYLVYKDSWRYRTFYQKGLKCSCCNRVGTYFKLKADSKSLERAHFNLFSEDGTLMTKDHIIPKSKGGPDCIDNFQTMCKECNEEKKNTMPEVIPDVLIDTRRKEIRATGFKNNKNTIEFFDVEDAVRYLLGEKIKIYNNKKITPKESAVAATRTTLKLLASLNGTEPYCGYNWERI